MRRQGEIFKAKAPPLLAGPFIIGLDVKSEHVLGEIQSVEQAANGIGEV